jgi:ribosomal-protein-alanine N-acetyltransferase
VTDIVPATHAHAEALAAIHAESVPPKEQWSVSSISALLSQPGVLAFADPQGGFVLTRVAGDESEILMLAVLPEFRRQGRGRLLLRSAEAAARARGSVAMYLEVDTRNVAARELYAGMGYRDVGLRRNYYDGGGDALVLRHELTRDEAAGV